MPRWLLPAAGILVVLVVLLFVAFGRGGSSSNAGTCLTDLSAHLPRSSKALFGTDLAAARDAGYDDGGALEDLGTSQEETGAIPDPLTEQFRYGQLVGAEEFTSQTGVEPGKIQCSLSDGRGTAMTGSFDQDAVSGSSVGGAGRLRATGDRLGFATGDADPRQLLEARGDGGIGRDEDVARVLTSLGDGSAYSVVVQVGDPDADDQARAAGLGVAPGEGDGKALVVAWSFGDDDAAKAGRPDVVEQVNEALEGNTQITAGDLVVDGSLVTAKIETRRAAPLRDILGRGLTLISDAS